MKLIMAVKDQAVEFFGQPFFVHTQLEAKRSFTMEVQNPESMMNKASQDYDLYQIGTYNQETGTIEGHAPLRLMRALEVPQTGEQK